MLNGRAGHAVQQARDGRSDAVRTAWQIGRHLQQRKSMFMYCWQANSLTRCFETDMVGTPVAIMGMAVLWSQPGPVMMSTVSSDGHVLVMAETVRTSGTVASMKALSSAQSRARAPCTTRQTDILMSGCGATADLRCTRAVRFGASRTQHVSLYGGHSLWNSRQASTGAGYQPLLRRKLS